MTKYSVLQEVSERLWGSSASGLRVLLLSNMDLCFNAPQERDRNPSAAAKDGLSSQDAAVCPVCFLSLLFQHFTPPCLMLWSASIHVPLFIPHVSLSFSSCLLCSFPPFTFTSAPPAFTCLFQSPPGIISSRLHCFQIPPSLSSFFFLLCYRHAFYVFKVKHLLLDGRWESGRLRLISHLKKTERIQETQDEMLTGIREVIYKQVIKKMILHLYLASFAPLQQETRCRSGEVL